jgi:hypothetical protein
LISIVVHTIRPWLFVRVPSSTSFAYIHVRYGQGMDICFGRLRTVVRVLSLSFSLSLSLFTSCLRGVLCGSYLSTCRTVRSTSCTTVDPCPRVGVSASSRGLGYYSCYGPHLHTTCVYALAGNSWQWRQYVLVLGGAVARARLRVPRQDMRCGLEDVVWCQRRGRGQDRTASWTAYQDYI